MNCICIAIDGPAGVGKTTVGKKIAEKLKYFFLDTGVMYRVVAYLCLKNNVNYQSKSDIQNLMDQLRFDIQTNGNIYCNGKKVDVNLLNSLEVNNIVSDIAKIQYVRSKLSDIQRKFSTKHSMVMIGRDIGTVVVPNAFIKIFLTANLNVRAKRRFNDANNKSLSFEEIQNNLQKRDLIDQQRDLAPLKKADDAIEIDTSNLDVDEVVNLFFKFFNEKLQNV